MLIAIAVSWLAFSGDSRNTNEENLQLLGTIKNSDIIRNLEIERVCVFEFRKTRIQRFIKFDLKASAYNAFSNNTFIDRSVDLAFKIYNIDSESLATAGISFSKNCHLIVGQNGETWIFDDDWKSVIVVLSR